MISHGELIVIYTIKICRPYITVKGVRKYAKDRRLKAFCWEVPIKKHQAYLAQKAMDKQVAEQQIIDTDSDKV